MAGLDEQPRLIEWTGERCVPWTDDLQVIYEHYHRYALSARFAAGKRVLDLASGEGYGAALLAREAAEVVGLELDEASVAHARGRYAMVGNLRFEQGSITDVSAVSGESGFDVITCFEALEHVTQQHELMRLASSKLGEAGIMLVSTPDIAVYTHEHGNDNPYHVRELTEAQFRELVGTYFRHVAVLRQHVAVGSVLIAEDADDPQGAVLSQTITRAAADSWEIADGGPHTYLVAVASNSPLTTVPAMATLLDPQQSWLGSRVGEQTAPVLDDAALRPELDRLAGEVRWLRRQAELDHARLSWQQERSGRLARQLADARVAREPDIGPLERAIAALGPAVPARGAARRLYERAGKLARRPSGSERPAAAVDVTTSDTPVVSIVIPVHGQWAYTRRCLESLEASQTKTPFEVIVVDDASPDESARILATCTGIRLIRTERNLGFVRASNHGSAHARGELLVFLNNDTEVQPGWLDTLVETTLGAEDIGLVGAKLVYPDGRLQECGGIVFSDGGAANYGHGDDPARGRYRSLRDVDYCSGACLMVNRELFDRIGGFDTSYSPAYYEDTDLAFAVRDAGYRTVVAPEAIVVHHEGVSHGTDLEAGHKRFQQLNRKVFADKWAQTLAGQFAKPSSGTMWLARQRIPGSAPRAGGLVLIADLQVPAPDKDSGSMRMWHLIALLLELGQRVVFCPMNDDRPARYADGLARAGVTVLADAAEREEFLGEAGAEIGQVILSRPTVAWHMAERIRICAPYAMFIYDTVDLHFVRLSREADLVARTGDSATAGMLRQRAELYRELELALVRASDRTLVVSESERAMLEELTPAATVEVVSNVHSLGGAATPAGRAGAVFVGGFEHAPNRDAAYWLAGEIWPLVRAKLPDAQLQLVGADPTGEISELAGDGVTVRGWVPDLAECYASMRMAVAPLRFGSGVKGKVGESLAAGVPVVGTELAFEGMRLRDGTEALIADTAEGVAELINALFADDELWRRLSSQGQQAVAAQFGPDSARIPLRRMLGLQA